MESITLKTVLKTGGEYTVDHVHRMERMLDRHVDCPAKFVCYSDVDVPGVITRPLLQDWQGWFSKIELFRDVEDSFYIDLDMTITGNITDMVMADSDFVTLRNMNPRIEGIGSAMMKWRGDKQFIHELFRSDPIYYMEIFGRSKIGTPYLGDQGLLWSLVQSNDNDLEVDFFQDIFPDRIKKFNQTGGDVKVYYGRNRPWKHG